MDFTPDDDLEIVSLKLNLNEIMILRDFFRIETTLQVSNILAKEGTDNVEATSEIVKIYDHYRNVDDVLRSAESLLRKFVKSDTEAGKVPPMLINRRIAKILYTLSIYTPQLDLPVELIALWNKIDPNIADRIKLAVDSPALDSSGRPLMDQKEFPINIFNKNKAFA